MQLYRTVENETLLRIEEDGGSAITVYIDGEKGEIASLLVREEDRRQGIGTALLCAAEQDLLDRGVRFLEADYQDSMEGMTDVLAAAGFDISDSSPICSLSVRKLLGSVKVHSYLGKMPAGTKYSSLEELMMMQWDELFDLVSSHDLRLSSEDLNGYSQRFSGVCYDTSDVPKAFILCSEYGKRLHVGFIGSVEGESPIYTLALLQGLLYEVISSGGSRAFDELTFVAVDEKLISYTEHYFGEGVLSEIDHVIFAKKEVGEFFEEEMDIEDDVSDEMEDEWRREVKSVPLQDNVGWKSVWHRIRTERALRRKLLMEMAAEEEALLEEEPEPEPTLGDEGEEALSMDEFTGEDTSEEEVDSVSLRDKTSLPDRRRYFDGNIDPFEIEIDFDKELDETEGLLNPASHRINNENVEEYLSWLPENVIQNLVRPWYRGLAVWDDMDDEPSALMVYELKNIEDEDTANLADVCWFRTDDTESGILILSEFEHELQEYDVKKIYMELTEVTEEERTLLSEEGYTLEEGESRDLVVTAGDIVKNSMLRGNAASYVKRLSDISERQFKRALGNCLFHGKKGLLEDMAFLPMEWYDNDVSCCVISDDRVTGLLLCHKQADGRLFVDLMFSSGPDAKLDSVQLMVFATQSLAEEWSPEDEVVIRRHNGQVRRLLGKLFSKRTGETVTVVSKGV